MIKENIVKFVCSLLILFTSIFCIVYFSKNIIDSNLHPLRFELFLTGVFFAIAILLMMAVYNLTIKFRLEKFKSDFISMINHEIRTPLTSILGALTIISNNLVGTIPPSMKEMMAVIQDNAERLSTVIKELMNSEKT